jgi:hypothetical protein
VYAWPFPIGPDDYEVACAEDELVVMCPAWIVGDRLGPGRHRWRTPDPSRPVSAYFVLTAPVEVSFDMVTQFMLPTTHQTVRLRASGSLQVRCMDPALLVAQFVGLPFDSVNEGVLRSVSRSIERMLARLLTRRVVMAGTPQAVTDRQMLSNIIEELIAYNPTAGAVFGVELVRFGHLEIYADDGSRPWHQLGNGAQVPQDLLDTTRGTPPPPERTEAKTMQQPVVAVPTTNPGGRSRAPTSPPRNNRTPPMPLPVVSSGAAASVSGEIGGNKSKGESRAPASTMQTPVVPPPTNTVSSSAGATASGTLDPNRPMQSTPPRRPGSVEVPQSVDEITHPGIDMRTPPPGTLQSLPAAGPGSRPYPDTPPSTVGGNPPRAVSGEIGGNKSSNEGDGLAQGTPAPKKRVDSEPDPGQESRGSILGIGVAHIGSSGVASGEITKKIAPGGRVLVPGPNGLMQSATVRQLLSGYYELEVGGSGETIWVPVSGVVPE